MAANEHRSKEAPLSPLALFPESQVEFDLEFYSLVLKRSPESVPVLRLQAALLGRAGRYGESLLLDERLARLLPKHCLVHYNLACSLARVGRTEEALSALTEAFRLGYDDLPHLENDSDLESLHDLPQYQKLVATLAKKPKR